MIRTNLSTRPFYNERAVHVAIGVAAVLVAALTLWNVVRIVRLSAQSTELATRVNSEHAEAAELMAAAAEIRGKIDQTELQHVVHAAREANALIDQRTFSWTAFFNRLESTMPPDVMLTSVRPSIKNGVSRITMTVLGRRAEDVDEFIEKLEAIGAFEQVLASQQDRTEDGLYRVVIDSVYTGLEDMDPAAEKTGAETPQAQAPVAQTRGAVR